MSELLVLLVEVTAVFSVALLGVRLASGARAAVRHLILASAFGVVFILPLAMLVSPSVVVEIPGLPSREIPLITANAITDISVVPEPVDTQLSTVETTASATAMVTAPATARSISTATWLLLAWAIVGLIALVPVGASLSHLRSIRRRGQPWPEGMALLNELAHAAGLQPPPVLLYDGIAGPITGGVLRPVIVLPSGALTWSETHVANALMHELEHVRRRDWTVHLATRAVCALYWFHPLVWLAWRALRLEAERACDDAVLAREDAAVYAEQLLGLARSLKDRSAQPGIPMASGSDLSSRITSVLNSTLPRGRTGKIAMVSIVVAAVVAVAVLASLRATGPASVAAPPGPADSRQRVDVQPADGWGDATDGVQLRLLLADVPSQAGTDKSSPLQVQIRNRGRQTISFIREALVHPEIEVDGVWYTQTLADDCCSAPTEVAPDDESTAVFLPLPRALTVMSDVAPTQSIALPPGRHSLRIRLPVRDPAVVRKADSHALALTSNLIQTEVPPPPPTREFRHNPVALNCTPGPGRAAEEIQGRLKRGDRFIQATSSGWILKLIPQQPREYEYGWTLQVSAAGREDEDLAGLTPPLHFGLRPVYLFGWHFRNADNTGPNDGSVNADGELREFIFSPAVGREIKYNGIGSISGDDIEKVRSFGRGWLFIDSYRLTPPQKGAMASFESLQFRACLSWPADAQPVRAKPDAPRDSAANSPGTRHSFDWAADAYYGRSGRYLALPPDASLHIGDPVLVLGSPQDRGWKPKVMDIMDANQIASARKTFAERGFMDVYKDKKLRDEIGWYWTFKDEIPSGVARLSADGSNLDDMSGWDFIAVANLPANVIVLEPPARKDRGAPPVTMAQAEARALASRLKGALDGRKCMTDRSLIRGIRYAAPGQKHDVVELFVGNPVMRAQAVDGSTMASIAMCELIVADGELLRTWEFSRSSSEEERVDSGPPTLNDDIWYATSDVTVGYLSVDGGGSWKRALINEGFEGTAYVIENARSGTRVFDKYHYTTH